MSNSKFGAAVAGLCALLLSGCVVRVPASDLLAIQAAVEAADSTIVYCAVVDSDRPGIAASRVSVFVSTSTAEVDEQFLMGVLRAIDASAPDSVKKPIAVTIRASATDATDGTLVRLGPLREAIGFDEAYVVTVELTFTRQELADFIASLDG